MAELVRNPCRFGCHIQIVCTHGSAVISTGIQSYSMRRGTGLFLLGGGLVQVVEPSPDFRVRMLLYPKDLMMKVLIPLDTDFLNYLHEYPYFDGYGGDAVFPSDAPLPQVHRTEFSPEYAYVPAQLHPAQAYGRGPEK